MSFQPSRTEDLALMSCRPPFLQHDIVGDRCLRGAGAADAGIDRCLRAPKPLKPRQAAQSSAPSDNASESVKATATTGAGNVASVDPANPPRSRKASPPRRSKR